MGVVGQVDKAVGTDAATRGAVDPFDMDVRQVQGGQPVNEVAGTLIVGTAVVVWSVAKNIAVSVSFSC